MSTFSPVGKTSLLVAASRARESRRPNRLFNDPYAEALAGDVGVQMLTGDFDRLAVENKHRDADQGDDDPRADVYLAIRTRFLDDHLLAAAAEPGIRQFVDLAAGMDSRAFRLDWPQGVRFFEVDQPYTFDHKEPILAAAGAQPRCDRRIVPADLTDPDWPAKLTQAGYDLQQPAFFLVEGLLVYLTENEATQLIRTLTPLCAPGSRIAFDLPNANYFTSKYTRPYVEHMAKIGSPWRFGHNHPERWLKPFGWKAKVWRVGEEGAEYGRWPFPKVPGFIPGLPRYYFVVADRPADA